MKKGFYLATTILAATLGTVTQTFGQAPPPPPPLIYASPHATELKEFIDSDGGFKVSFPGTPQKDVFVGENVNQITYKVYRKGSNSSVSILTFPIKMELNQKELIDSYRNDLAKLSAQGPRNHTSKVSNLLVDRETKISGRNGWEFAYESDFHFTHVAVFVVGNRFFEVKSDVTNWHILKSYHPELVKAFQSEAERFIKSFSLTK